MIIVTDIRVGEKVIIKGGDMDEVDERPVKEDKEMLSKGKVEEEAVNTNVMVSDDGERGRAKYEEEENPKSI